MTPWNEQNKQIDVMFLYDEAVLDRVTAQQMETLIADELPASNEAADNSLINVRFNLVHAGEASVFDSLMAEPGGKGG